MKNHKEIYIQMLMIGRYLVLNGVENHDNPKGIKHRSEYEVLLVKNQAGLDHPSPNGSILLSPFYGCVHSGQDKRQKLVMQRSPEGYDFTIPFRFDATKTRSKKHDILTVWVSIFIDCN